ncbi:hypothetical protein [Anaeromyxobacter diazotrophicus]|uniref:Uncharacterized protein n=1 Tax=Anaeromyxobacter diazotrophicus TaxID=2590199 RepID=A0A7I9VNI8_9BACT|nr:hypothetical protein [Anaeromyxobacter diazotrophicus]GEJ57976.1 hypothetical protein AMYX_27170 [Anaeromyxobacter diazotrophicus]
MAGLLFVSQAMLEAWSGQGRIAFAGQTMSLRAGPGSGRAYALDPAVRFLRVVGAECDPHGLVAKVKTDAQLRALGGQRMGDSVLLGDVAYEVEPGFLAAASAPPAAPEQRDPAAVLARFLSENLS